MKTSSDNAAENLFQTFLLINAIYSQAKERTILSDTYSHYVLTGFTAYLVFCKHNCYKKKKKENVKEKSKLTITRTRSLAVDLKHMK